MTLFQLPQKTAKKNKLKNQKIDSIKDKASKQESNKESSTESSVVDDDTAKASIQTESEKEEQSYEENRDSWSFIEKVRQFGRRFLSLIHQFIDSIKNIKYTITRICDSMKSVVHDISYYKAVLNSDVFRQTYHQLTEELKYVFKKLRPTKWKGDFVIGTQDPYTLAQILSVYGILYPLIGNHIYLNGDFSGQNRVEGQMLIKGKLCMFTFVQCAFKIYFNKNVRKVIRLFKKEEELDG